MSTVGGVLCRPAITEVASVHEIRNQRSRDTKAKPPPTLGLATRDLLRHLQSFRCNSAGCEAPHSRGGESATRPHSKCSWRAHVRGKPSREAMGKRAAQHHPRLRLWLLLHA